MFEHLIMYITIGAACIRHYDGYNMHFIQRFMTERKKEDNNDCSACRDMNEHFHVVMEMFWRKS